MADEDSVEHAAKRVEHQHLKPVRVRSTPTRPCIAIDAQVATFGSFQDLQRRVEYGVSARRYLVVSALAMASGAANRKRGGVNAHAQTSGKENPRNI